MGLTPAEERSTREVEAQSDSEARERLRPPGISNLHDPAAFAEEINRRRDREPSPWARENEYEYDREAGG